MTRLRDALAPVLGDARYVLVMLAIALLFVVCVAGRIVVAAAQDVREAARRIAG